MKNVWRIENMLHLPSPLQEFHLSQFQQKLFIKRDDLIHPVITGNKWRKLHGHLSDFDASNYTGIISMGGLHSNHLHALAYVCFILEIPFTALMYGIQTLPDAEILKDFHKWKTKCIPISRVTAEQLRNTLAPISFPSFEKYYWIDEGGGGVKGRKGIHQLVSEMPNEFDAGENLLLVGCGTGTTIQGILESTQYIHMASLQIVSKAYYSFAHHPRMIWLSEFYSKKFSFWNDEMQDFKTQFEQETQLTIDKTYAVPLLMAYQYYQNQSSIWKNIYYLHTGGRKEV